MTEPRDAVEPIDDLETPQDTDSLGPQEGEPDASSFEDSEEIKATSAVGKFRRNTGAGLVLNGVALGLAEIYDPVVKEDPPIVQEESDVPFDRDVDAVLDPEDPAASVVTFRNGSGAGA